MFNLDATNMKMRIRKYKSSSWKILTSSKKREDEDDDDNALGNGEGKPGRREVLFVPSPPLSPPPSAPPLHSPLPHISIHSSWSPSSTPAFSPSFPCFFPTPLLHLHLYPVYSSTMKYNDAPTHKYRWFLVNKSTCQSQANIQCEFVSWVALRSAAGGGQVLR